MDFKKTRGRVDQTARIAGIHPRGLYSKMKRLDLRKQDFKK
jgi:two-component system response regulator AtoC